MTEKPNCPKELQKNCDEIVFEQFEFAAYYRCIGTVDDASNVLSDETDTSRPDNDSLQLFEQRTATLRTATMSLDHRHLIFGHHDSSTL